LAFQIELGVAVRAAQIAGEILRSHFGGSQRVRHKGEIDLVTDADEAAEHAIAAEIRRHFPDDRILAEEGTVGGDNPARLWIVDPLDGTTNFAHGYPVFAVSIALEVAGVVELGVVYQPVLRELFTAARGEGATCNAAPVRVSATDRLGKAMLCSGFPYAREEIPSALRYWERLILRAQALRRDGAAAIDLCYVATGRFDGFWERSLQPWDVAAGGLIVSEAGGRLSDYQGGRYDIRAREVVASNGLIHDEMLAVMAQARARSLEPEGRSSP
jgi:myo-inositol-1(or 4)-monophosphatase